MTDNGGTAFPWSSNRPNGMSLRDYFAAAALTGLLLKDSTSSVASMVYLAYLYADGMLVERMKGED